MKFINEIGFCVGLILIAIILNLLPYPENKVAALLLERQWSQQDSGMRDTVVNHCDALNAKNETAFERLFQGWVGMDASVQEGSRNCRLVIHSAASSRFHLHTTWAVNVQIDSDAGGTLLYRQFQVETPKPLVLLPIAAFLLALVFELSFLNFAVMLVAYFFLLSGANLIRSLNIFADIALITLTANQAFASSALIIVWLAIAKARTDAGVALPMESSVLHRTVNRIGSALFGFWNPLLFTLFGKVLVPIRAPWILSFLDFQLVLTCLSLYLFSLNFGNLPASVWESLTLPRYFTFTVVLLFVTSLLLKPLRKHRVIWKIPHFSRAIISFVVLESLAYLVPALRELNTLTRFGLAFLLSELAWPVGIPWRAATKIALPWLAILFAGLLTTVAAVELGVVDLALQLLNPRMHPRILYLFTFLAGLGLGFLTGSFSAAFFTLFAFLQSPPVPLLKAALLDGVIAGLFLSPLSLFNLLPAMQFNMGVRKLLQIRFGQLALPISIAMLVYTIANLTQVSILRPVCFVFCGLLAVAYTLRRSAWKVRHHRSLLATHNAEH